MPVTTSAALRTPNDRNFYEITEEDLPLQCPVPGTSLWNSHPRVFLALGEDGTAQCHYCGARYTLVRRSSSDG